MAETREYIAPYQLSSIVDAELRYVKIVKVERNDMVYKKVAESPTNALEFAYYSHRGAIEFGTPFSIAAEVDSDFSNPNKKERIKVTFKR